MEQFIDRDVELDQLADCYESETAEFVVIYRRSRPSVSGLDPEAVHTL